MNTKTFFLILIAMSILANCKQVKQGAALIPSENFKTKIDNKEIALYTLENKNGLAAQLTNYGARIVALWAPDRNGEFQDVTWGYPTIEEYIKTENIYCGPVVGRFGNRINKGKFTLNGKEYQLTINNNGNHLHGGTKGFECKVWDAEMTKKGGYDAVKMSYLSKDGEEGYPGNLTLSVTYYLTDNNELILEYSATTDAPTIINPTSHCYFNLSGTSNNTILDHVLKINADKFLPVDEELIPTGEMRDLSGTPMDFREFTAIGDRIDEKYEPLIFGKGYDHNYILNKTPGVYGEAAVIYCPSSGIRMTVMTDQPGLQFYSGNFMDGSYTGKRGDVQLNRSGFALEAQNFPDAPNHANFPSAALNPGETYTQKTSYKFDIAE